MLKLITLATCVAGFVFLVPKALAEFRHAYHQIPPRPSDNDENKHIDDAPKPGVAA